MAKIIAITSSKGGAGKTTLTSILATSFFNDMQIRVAVVDIDPQKSLYNMRLKELKELKEKAPSNNSYLHKTITTNVARMGTFAASVYPIDLFKSIKEIQSDINSLKSKYDVILLDFPGSLNLHVNTLNLLKELDFIFIPIYVDANTVDSSISFYQALKKMKHEGKLKCESYLFFNKYNDVNGKNGMAFKSMGDLLEKNNYSVLKSKVYDSIEVERYSTVTSLSPSNAKKNISHFTEEIFNIIK